MRRGRFVSFEGGEGAGKTTLIEKLCAYFQQKKYPVLKTRAPGGTALGQQIRTLLLSPHQEPLSPRSELLLFLADRAQHVDEVIQPALKAKQIVLCDRFNDSTLAYQSAGRGCEEKFVRLLCTFACHGLQPDLTLYLDLDPKVGFARTSTSRSGKDRIESETLRFHQKIRKAYHKIASQEPKRVILIDASRSPEDVYNQAREKIDALLTPSRK